MCARSSRSPSDPDLLCSPAGALDDTAVHGLSVVVDPLKRGGKGPGDDPSGDPPFRAGAYGRRTREIDIDDSRQKHTLVPSNRRRCRPPGAPTPHSTRGSSIYRRNATVRPPPTRCLLAHLSTNLRAPPPLLDYRIVSLPSSSSSHLWYVYTCYSARTFICAESHGRTGRDKRTKRTIRLLFGRISSFLPRLRSYNARYGSSALVSPVTLPHTGRASRRIRLVQSHGDTRLSTRVFYSFSSDVFRVTGGKSRNRVAFYHRLVNVAITIVNGTVPIFPNGSSYIYVYVCVYAFCTTTAGADTV